MATRVEAIVSNHFGLTIEAKNLGFWKSVSGLEVSLDVVPDTQTDEKGVRDTKKHPGQVAYGDITLSRGFGPMDLYDWFQEVTKDPSKRVSGNLVLYDNDYKPVAQWDFFAAFPSSLTMGDVTADDSSLVVETMTLAVEEIERIR